MLLQVQLGIGFEHVLYCVHLSQCIQNINALILAIDFFGSMRPQQELYVLPGQIDLKFLQERSKKLDRYSLCLRVFSSNFLLQTTHKIRPFDNLSDFLFDLRQNFERFLLLFFQVKYAHGVDAYRSPIAIGNFTFFLKLFGVLFQTNIIENS